MESSQAKIEDSATSPSFDCYSSDSLTTTLTVARVIHEQHEAARFHNLQEDDFEFSLKETDSKTWAVFSAFKLDLVEKDKVKADEFSYFITNPLAKLFVNDELEDSSPSSSCSSSEVDELEKVASGTYCVWQPKVEGGSQTLTTRCKKSSSTGRIGSKKWCIKYLLRRSNSDGRDPMVVLSLKIKDDFRKQKRVLKAQTNVHEQFYVQRRAENEIVRKKSYLPYKQNLVGLFASSNGMAKRLSF